MDAKVGIPSAKNKNKDVVLRTSRNRTMPETLGKVPIRLGSCLKPAAYLFAEGGAKEAIAFLGYAKFAVLKDRIKAQVQFWNRAARRAAAIDSALAPAPAPAP